MEDALSRSLSNSPVARDARPFTTGNVAFATLKSRGHLQTAGMAKATALFVAINDAAKVTEVLTRDAQKNNVNGLDYYTVTGDTHCMAVMGNYLVTVDKPDELTRLEAVRKGETPSITRWRTIKQARAALPADSNLMLFFSANGVSQAAQTAQGMAGSSLFSRIGQTPSLCAVCGGGHGRSRSGHRYRRAGSHRAAGGRGGQRSEFYRSPQQRPVAQTAGRRVRRDGPVAAGQILQLRHGGGAGR